MNYGVVVVTYNRHDLLVECVEHINKQTISPQHIIIVDNNSTDNTSNYLSSIQDYRYRIIRLDENIGASGGFSVGISKMLETDVDYILIIDDDAHINKDYLENIDNFLKSHKDVKAVSGTVYELGKIALFHRRIIKNKLILSDKNVDFEEYEKEFFFYDLFSFCGIVLEREIINDIGFPRSDYFTQCTDTDYSIRVRTRTKIANVNKAILNHKVNKGSKKGEISYKMYYQIRNRIVTIVSNSSPVMKPIVKLSLSIAYMARIIIRRIKIIVDYQNSEIYRKHIEIFSDALHDAINENMGINIKYMPGY